MFCFCTLLLISELEIGEIKPFEKPLAISPTYNITKEVLHECYVPTFALTPILKETHFLVILIIEVIIVSVKFF